MHFSHWGACVLVIIASLVVSSRTSAQTTYDGYFLHTGIHPDGPVSWGEDQREVQGITHDDHYWYITATDRTGAIDKDVDNAFLWRIPLNRDLDLAVDTDPDVMGLNLYSGKCAPLWYNGDPLQGYVHWGDLDHFCYNGVDFLLIPMTSPMAKPAVWIFRASNFTIAARLILPGPSGDGQSDIGWCAVDPLDYTLCTSNDRTSIIYRYQFPWDSVPSSGYANIPASLEAQYIITGSDGKDLLDLHNMQGGEFTPSGDLLYLSNGRGSCHGIGADDPGQPEDGVHAFALVGNSFREVRQSRNRCYGGPGNSSCGQPLTDPFDFSYDFGCGVGETHSDQPEGLTIWDLDGKGAPNMSGQLHVLVASVGLVGNMAQLQHFSNRIHVDATAGENPSWAFPLPGTSKRPFRSLATAMSWYPIWGGAEIVLQAGAYPENGTFGQRVRLVSSGGSAVIGK